MNTTTPRSPPPANNAAPTSNPRTPPRRDSRCRGCLFTIDVAKAPPGLPELTGVVVTVAVSGWRRCAVLGIVAGTAGRLPMTYWTVGYGESRIRRERGHVAYFERTGGSSFRATEHVGGAWDPDEQHIAPALGLLAHIVELDRDARRSDGLVIARLCYDILGTIPVDEVETDVRVVRPGRSIELVEATLRHNGRDAVVLRAWLMQPRDTSRLEATSLLRIPPPAGMPRWDATSIWPGRFIESAEVRREEAEPGRASFWVRTPLPLIRDEPVSLVASAAGLFDVANGMTVRASRDDVAFPNLDLTAHLFAEPRGEWVGFDTTVSFGPGGIGLTSSVVHDTHGPIGTVSQILTIRPR